MPKHISTAVTHQIEFCEARPPAFVVRDSHGQSASHELSGFSNLAVAATQATHWRMQASGKAECQAVGTLPRSPSSAPAFFWYWSSYQDKQTRLSHRMNSFQSSVVTALFQCSDKHSTGKSSSSETASASRVYQDKQTRLSHRMNSFQSSVVTALFQCSDKHSTGKSSSTETASASRVALDDRDSHLRRPAVVGWTPSSPTDDGTRLLDNQQLHRVAKRRTITIAGKAPNWVKTVL